MSDLVNYIVEHCIRGTCICGNCIDSSYKNFQPDGHTADVQFFKVALKNNPSTAEKEIIKDNFIKFIKSHRGMYKNINIFDGGEHNFIEIGGWIGNQGIALMLMGMGELLGIWEVSTPNKVAPDYSEETRSMLAGAGFISIKYKTKG